MGINYNVDLGGVEVKERKEYKLLDFEDGDAVEAVVKSFKFKVSSAKNPMVEVKYEITDDNYVDVDGGTDYGSVWDNIVFTEKAAKMAKLKLLGLGYDGVNDLKIESKEDFLDFVEDLKDNYLDTPVVLILEHDEYNGKTKAKVRFVNQPQISE